MKLQSILFLLILFYVSTCALAQTPVPRPVDPKRESPRATLETFFNAFQKPRAGVTPDPLEETIQCLDLSDIPPEYRELKGLETAAQLKEVLNAVENFNIADAPADTGGLPFVILYSQQGEITITRQISGEWLFTRETVRSVPLLHSALEEQRRTTGTAVLMQSGSFGAQVRSRMPAMLLEKTLMLERWQWLGLFVLGIMGVIFWHIIKFLSRLLIGRILRKHRQYLTEEQVKKLSAPVGLLAFVFTFYLGLPALALTQNSLTFTRTALFLLTAFALTWLAYRAVDIIAARLTQKARETNAKTDDLLVPFITLIIRIAVVVVAGIFVADNLRFDVTSMIAGLGIGGIAIALASQETLSNFIGSLVLLIERPFTAEDRIEIDGIKGTVKEVGLRSTKIMSLTNSVITMPNSRIVKANIINEGIKIRRRWTIKLYVPYKNGAEKVENLCNGIKQLIKASDMLDSEDFKIFLYDVLPASLDLRIEVTFKVDEYGFEMGARHRFITELLRLADKLEIELEVPN
jgi:MscS family membrane protein